MQSSRPADTYNPTYFLASLGAGGIVVTFFMFLMFWIPHPGQPVPVFEDIMAAWANGAPLMQATIAIAMAGIAGFAVLNVKSLIWNLQSWAVFRKTPAYEALKGSNAEASVLAMPLAMAMTVNVGFIVGLVFVPQLWSIVEYLFPAAMSAFALIGLVAFRMIGSYLSRVLGEGRGFNPEANNSFVQLVPAFALTMIAVGFAAPAAMSTAKLTVSASLILSTFLAVVSVIYVLAAAFPAMASMLRGGVAREAAPTLMIIVPIVTVLSILMLRQSHGLHTTFDAHANPGETLVFLTQMLSIQVAFLLLGGSVLWVQGYFKDFIIGSRTSPGSYALVCPAVAFSVLLHFFANKGLVGAGVIEKFGAGYWAVTAVAIAAQIIAIAMVLRLNRQHFRRVSAATIPAE